MSIFKEKEAMVTIFESIINICQKYTDIDGLAEFTCNFIEDLLIEVNAAGVEMDDMDYDSIYYDTCTILEILDPELESDFTFFTEMTDALEEYINKRDLYKLN